MEPPLLGAFGFPRRDTFYNADTIRYMKAIAALHDGGVLGAFRGLARGKLVWEIGGGWGGFAFHFKHVCPGVTYVISGLPETMLLSSVYLQALVPDARVRFFDPDAPEAIWNNWSEADFIFIPEGALSRVTLPHVELVLDLQALQSMTAARRDAHIQRAFSAGARYFFSERPAPCFLETLPPVWQAIARLYWPHEVPPRMDTAAYGGVPPLIPEGDYAHLVGWRRLRA